MTRPTLLIVIASTRPGRLGLPVGRWFADRATAHGQFDVEVADLLVENLPMLDEPHHPRLRKYTKEHTFRWSGKVAAADAFVFVTPEYNYGMPGSLKNAIDYLSQEWRDKPLGLVSYGGVAAGTRSVAMIKLVASALKLVPVTESVAIPFVFQFIQPDGTVKANDVMEAAATAMLDELVRVGSALAPLRQSG